MISVVAGFFVLLTFVLFPKIRTASFGYILLMTLCDTGMGIVVSIYPPDDSTWLCNLQVDCLFNLS